MKEIILDSVTDGMRMVPFLFLTYLVMEWLEHKTGDMTKKAVEKAGHFGPLIGAVLGAFPQCGFSAAAGSLYAGRVITLGTLFAIYLSTSDEMLPVLISEAAGAGLIIRILGCKIVIGMGMGFVIDLLLRRQRKAEEQIHIGELCSHEHCHCGADDRGIVRPALYHTLQITCFVLLITFGLNLAVYLIGEAFLTDLFSQNGILGVLLSGLIGLFPNCASSVLVTQLYLEGVLDFGAMLSGLLTGSGIGLLVLYRVNHNWRENLGITAGLYLIGVVCGIAANAAGMM